MSDCFAIVSDQGEYSDRITRVIRVFANELDAQNFVEIATIASKQVEALYRAKINELRASADWQTVSQIDRLDRIETLRKNLSFCFSRGVSIYGDTTYSIEKCEYIDRGGEFVSDEFVSGYIKSV